MRYALFLDEVADLPVSAQSRLLRVSQERTFSKVGSTKSQTVDVRLLPATHKALRRETRLGAFREDLMYRLRVVPLFLPRLMKRGRDTEVLAWRFIDEFNRFGRRQITGISDADLQAFLEYSWPGNIRELRNNIENAFAIGEGDTLNLKDLTPELRGEPPPGEPESHLTELNIGAAERKRIIAALNHTEGNKEEAAKAVNMSRSTLWRKAKTFGIH